MKFCGTGPRILGFALLVGLLAGCETTTAPARAGNTRAAPIYSPKPWFVEEGIASWYGGRWIGRLTANGERYRAGDMTAAHKKLPFHTRVRVTDLKTGKQVIVRINNRGPFKRGRIIDLSVAAAKQLGTYDRGLAKVRIEALKEIPLAGPPNLRVPPEGPKKKPADKPVPKPTPKPTPKLAPKPTPTPESTPRPPRKPTPKPGKVSMS